MDFIEALREATGGQWCGSAAMCDFEKALAASLQECGIRVRNCYFHFIVAISEWLERNKNDESPLKNTLGTHPLLNNELLHICKDMFTTSDRRLFDTYYNKILREACPSFIQYFDTTYIKISNRWAQCLRVCETTAEEQRYFTLTNNYAESVNRCLRKTIFPGLKQASKKLSLTELVKQLDTDAVATVAAARVEIAKGILNTAVVPTQKVMQRLNRQQYDA